MDVHGCICKSKYTPFLKIINSQCAYLIITEAIEIFLSISKQFSIN